MRYTKINLPDGIVERVAHGLIGYRQPYRDLHRWTIPGWLVHAAYSHNRFDNRLHDSDLARYELHRRTYGSDSAWFAEIFADRVMGREKEPGEECPGEGFTPITCLVFDEALKMWLPPRGLYLPVKDTQGRYVFFKKLGRHGTLVPERVVPFDRRDIAEKAFSKADLPSDEISGFGRLDDYRPGEELSVGRGFGSFPLVGGRFGVIVGRLPSDSGDSVASRPTYKNSLWNELFRRDVEEFKLIA